MSDIIPDTRTTTFLYDYQLDAVRRMHNGCILCGSVGSGKSRTALYYYFKENGGWITKEKYTPMKNPKDLIIITTAKKRDSLEWIKEVANYSLVPDEKTNRTQYGNRVIIDSWNNLPKYRDYKNCFFLLDEQRLVSYGAWTKTFLEIAKYNDWILLSATPADHYGDYLPIFLANGFFKNKTQFNSEHVVFSRYTKYPKIERYVNTRRLDRLVERVLVTMDYYHDIVKHNENIICDYDMDLYKTTINKRVNPFVEGYIPCYEKDPDGLLVGSDIELQDVTPILNGWNYEPENGDYVKLVNEPIRDAGSLCYTLRKIVNSHDSRQVKLLEILESHPRAIIFYNFTYELDILRSIAYGEGVEVAEWNGQKHQPVPTSDRWVYLCQYTSACEGWECIRTNCIVFFSQNYSFKVVTQAAGRVDRLNTPFDELYYYHLKSHASIDLAIAKSLRTKETFNERKFAKFD